MHWVFWLVIGLIVYKIVIAVQNFKSVKWMEANPELARKQNPKLGCSGVLETPPSLPIIGHLANLNLNAIAPSIVPWGKVYGRVFKIRIPDDFTVIADPALLSRVYAGSDWANFDRGGVVSELFDDIGGGLVLLENGEKWQKFRTIFQKSFTKRRLNMSQDFLVSTSKKLCDQVYLFSKSQQVFDLQEEVQKMTFDIIGKLAFGIDFNTQSQHQSQANDCFRTMLSSLMVRFTSPVHWWKYITLPFDRKYERAVNVMHGLIRECIQNYKKNGIDPDDVCALADLMRADDKLPEREIVLHIITLLFAGHDTTTNAIVWVIYFLSKYPEVLAKVRAEIADKPNLSMDPNVESSYPYLKAVIKEVLRLRTSAPSLGRIMNADTDISWLGPDGETMNHHTLKKGDNVMLNLWMNHHHPQSWSNPEEFNPNRFLLDSEKPSHPSSWLSFGAGPRICVGMRLAMKEITVTTIDLITKFNFILKDPNVGYHQDVTLRAAPGMFVTAVPI